MKNSMSNILVIGDPHFKRNNLHIMEKICEEIISIISDRTPDLCVILGDVLHEHSRISMLCLTAATKFLIEISKLCPLVVLIGNHDRVNNSDFMSDIHPFVGLKNTANITIVDKALFDHERNFIYCPYVAPGRFQEALESVGYRVDSTVNKPKLIFAHQEFHGSKMGVVKSTHGDPWNAGLPLVISGHIHEYQELSGVIYTGTPIQHDYGESTDKAIMLVTLTNERNGVRTATAGVAEDCEAKRNKQTAEQDVGQIKIERIRLTSAVFRKNVHIKLGDISKWRDLVNIEPDTLIRVLIHLDALELKGLKQNKEYQELKKSVDKVETVIDTDKSSVAAKVLTSVGIKDKTDMSVISLARSLLADDLETLMIFNDEICVS